MYNTVTASSTISKKDQFLKNFFSDISILAPIVYAVQKYINPDFDYSIDEIGSFIQKSSITVDKMIPETLKETSASSDQDMVIFDFLVPIHIKEQTIIFHLEFQNKEYPGYSLLNRVQYDRARNLSDTKGISWKNSEYDEIPHITSVWLLLGTSAVNASSLFELLPRFIGRILMQDFPLLP